MEHQSYVRDLTIHASSAAMRAALTDPVGLAAWWSPAAGDGGTGGRLEFWHRQPEPLVIRVGLADPGEVRWQVVDYPGDPEWVGTTISFSWRTDGAATVLNFRHQGLTPALACFAWCSPGWDHFLDSLRGYLETGHGTPLLAPVAAP